MLDLKLRYQRNESFVFRKIEDETILVPIKDNVGDMGSIYSLNEIGALIWDQLDGKQDLKKIKNHIMNEYAVAPGKAAADLKEFVSGLIEIEAVKLVDEVH